MSLPKQNQIEHAFQETEKLLYFVRADHQGANAASRLDEIQYGILRSIIETYVVAADAAIPFNVSVAYQFLSQISKWSNENHPLVSCNVYEKIKNDLYDKIAQFPNHNSSTKSNNRRAYESSDGGSPEPSIKCVNSASKFLSDENTGSSIQTSSTNEWRLIGRNIKFQNGMVAIDIYEWLLKHFGTLFQSFRNCSICVQYTIPKADSPKKYFSCSDSNCPFRLKLTCSGGVPTVSESDVNWNVYWNGSHHLDNRMSNRDESVQDTILLLPKTKQLLRRILKKDPGTSFSEAFTSVSGQLNLDSAAVRKIRNQAWEHFRYHKRNLSKKGPLSHSQQVLDFVSSRNFYSILPTDYIPRSTYRSQDELLVSLGLTKDEREQPFTVPIKEFPDAIVKEMSSFDFAKLMSTLVFVSVSHIWTLYQFVKNQNPTLSVIHIDESLKFVQGTFQALTMGPVVVDTHRDAPGKISRRFFPMGHVFTSCLKSYAIYAFLESMNELSKRLFDADLHIYRFVTDYSPTLRKGCLQYNKDARFSICYPHIVGSFSGKHSWMQKFCDRKNIAEVKRNVSQLYQCITREQFTTMFQKLYSYWNTHLKEVDFAEFFLTHYGPDSPCKWQWFLGCTGVVFLLPNNNPIENYWGELRGQPFNNIPPVIRTNLALNRFVSTEVPKLLIHDSRNRKLDKAHLYHMQTKQLQLVDTVTLALASLLDKYHDIVTYDIRDNTFISIDSCKNYDSTNRLSFFVNRPEAIGSEISRSRIVNFLRSLEGRPTDEESRNISADEFFDNFSGLCCVFLVEGGRIHQNLLPNLQLETLFTDGLVCTCRSFLVDGMCSASVLVQDCLGAMVPSMQERMTQVYGIRPNKVQVRRRRYSEVTRTQYSRIEYQHFGIPRNKQTPSAVHFLFHLSTTQLRIVQLRRGFGGRIRDDEVNRLDMLEDIISGTWIGNMIRSSHDHEMTQDKQPNGTEDTTDLSNNDVVNDVNDHLETSQRIPNRKKDSMDASNYEVVDKSTIQTEDKDFTIAAFPRIHQYSVSANSVADVIYDSLQPDSCTAYLQDTAQGDPNARIDTTNTCVLLSYLGVFYFLVERDIYRSPQTRHGVSRLILTAAPDFLESELAAPLRPTPSCFMEPDEVLNSLKAWVKSCYPNVFENSYTIPFLGTIVARPGSEGENFLRSEMQMHMNRIPIENRVAAICFHSFHQIFILRYHQLHLGIEEACDDLDYEYHVVDTLPFDASSALGGRCVRYKLHGINALIHYIQRRVAFALMVAKESGISMHQFKGSEKDEMMLQIFSYLDFRPVERLANEHSYGDEVCVPISIMHQRRGTQSNRKVTINDEKSINSATNVQRNQLKDDPQHTVSFDDARENQTIGSASTSLSLMTKRLKEREKAFMLTAQKFNDLANLQLDVADASKFPESESICGKLYYDDISDVETAVELHNQELLPSEIIIPGRHNYTYLTNGNTWNTDTISRVVKSLSAFWTNLDPRVMLNLQPWLLFEYEMDADVSDSCLKFAMKNRKTLQSMNVSEDFRLLLFRELQFPFLRVARVSKKLLPLHGISFCRLSYQEWLDDDNIDFFLRLLISYQSELEDLLGSTYSKKFHFFFPTWFELLLRLNGINQANTSMDKILAAMSGAGDSTRNIKLRARENVTIDSYYKGHRPKDANITGRGYLGAIFPINIAGTHWITVVVFNENNTLYLFDLLNPTGRPRLPKSKWNERLRNYWNKRCGIKKPSDILQFHEHLLDIISEYLDHERIRRELPKINWGTEIVVSSKLQKDGYNCGVLSCIISWMTVQLRRPPLMKDLEKAEITTNALRIARKWMAYSMLQSSVWIPPLVPHPVRQQIELLNKRLNLKK